MNLSRFFATTNREAMRQVRLALGPDALIVSNRRVNGGVEIVAADQTVVLNEAEAGVVPDNPLPEASADHEVMQAIGAMRGELLGRIDDLAWAGLLRRTPQLMTLFQSLLGFGFSTALLRAMLKSMPDKLSTPAAFQWARNELITHLPIGHDEEQLMTPGAIIALIGPTGVGKTTTVAKLAARCVRRAGAENVILITTDTYRIGAYEQLKQYGQMMEVTVGVANSPDELLHMLEQVPRDKIVFIDNVGVSQRDGHVISQTAMLTRIPRPVSRLLVLNAASHGDTLDEVARLYAVDTASRLAGCIITKVDEANRLGTVLDTTIRYRLPIHYISNGQRVPQDLLDPDAAALIDRAFSKIPAVRPLFSPTEDDLLALLETARLSAVTADDSVPASAAVPAMQQLVSSLLALDGANVSQHVLSQAHEFIDGNIAGFQSYELWRQRFESGQNRPAAAEVAQQLLAGALSSFQGNQLLAMHASSTLQHGRDGVRVNAPVLFDGRGEALVVPLLQLQLGDTCLATDADAQFAQFEAVSETQVLLCQVRWFVDSLFGDHMVHLFERGKPSVWRELCSQNVQWISRCSGKQPIVAAGYKTLVASVAKVGHYHMIPFQEGQFNLSQVQGVPASDVLVWASAEPAVLAQRGLPEQPLQVLSVRLVRRSDGRQLAIYHALGRLLPTTLENQAWPLWLVIQAEARTVMQLSAALWPLLRGNQASPDLLQDALITVQTALALWSIQQIPQAAAARQVLLQLAGSRRPSRTRLAAALLKIYTSRAVQGPC